MKRLHKRISNCLWFDSQAEEAAAFYTKVFPNSHMGAITRYGNEGFEIHGRPEGSVMTVDFSLSGTEFMGLNGGPLFSFNTAVSYFVVLESESEADEVWKTLAEGGTILLPYQKYEWSEKYGWVQDRFGLSWQIAFGNISDVGQQVTPSLLFANEVQGRAEEALRFYQKVFEDSDDAGILKYAAGEEAPEGQVKFAQFRLCRQVFIAMDSPVPQPATFNEAVSFVVNCTTQKEIDRYWSRLTDGGIEGECGWLKDKFGMSWQVVPLQLEEMLKHPDRTKTERVTKAFLRMKKFNIDELEKAFAG